MRRTRASRAVDAVMEQLAANDDSEDPQLKRHKTVDLARREKRLLTLQRLGGLARQELPGPFLGPQYGCMDPAALSALKALRLETLWATEIVPKNPTSRAPKICAKEGKVLGFHRQNLKDFRRYYTHVHALACWAIEHHVHDDGPWVPFIAEHFRLPKGYNIGRLCVELSLMSALPGASRVGAHMDARNETAVEALGEERVGLAMHMRKAIVVLVALQPMTEELGHFKLALGEPATANPARPDPDYDSYPLSVGMGYGGWWAFDAARYHEAGANKTDNTRFMLSFTYVHPDAEKAGVHVGALTQHTLEEEEWEELVGSPPNSSLIGLTHFQAVLAMQRAKA